MRTIDAWKASIQDRVEDGRLVYIGSAEESRDLTGITISNMFLSGAGGECVRLRNNAHGNTIVDSVIQYCGMYGKGDGEDRAEYHNGEGVYIGTSPKSDGQPMPDNDTSSNNVVARNIIRPFGSECFNIKENAHDNVFENNVCSGNAESAEFEGSNVELRGYANIVRNNQISDSAGYTIKIQTDGEEYDRGGNVVENNQLSGAAAETFKIKSEARRRAASAATASSPPERCSTPTATARCRPGSRTPAELARLVDRRPRRQPVTRYGRAVGSVVDGVSPARAVADRMAEAARTWLDSLTAEQRAVATGAVPADDASDAERRRWFYTPTDHGGLTVHQQRPAQQRAAMRLVATGLSTAGYVTVATTMGLENVLDHTEGFVTPVRPRARPRPRPVLPAGVRRARRRGAVGLAVRRPPRVAEQPRRRRRPRRHHPVLHGRRPRRRRRCSAAG